MIAVHFSAILFLALPGVWGKGAEMIGTVALVWAGLLFQSAVVPYREEISSRWMIFTLLAANALYVILLTGGAPVWALNGSAALLGIGPLAITLITLRTINRALRWTTIVLYAALALFLLAIQHWSGAFKELALNAMLFIVYLGCSINFFFTFRRTTAGAFVTIAGFCAWASVFVISPILTAYLPQVHIESEVWNLPKYVVAVGMLLLLLEDQIEHNKHLALHDALTGLPNRRHFEDHLARAVERARRAKTQAALLLIDLDQFKMVNDTLGHHAGDLLLKRVGAICTRRMRRSDTVARTGGDEFSIIMEEPTSRAEAEYVAHSLIQLLKEPFQLEGQTVRTGASVGVAVYPDDAIEIEHLCIAADKRMYENKQRAASIANTIVVQAIAQPTK
jgi:diguanylate cyclase (GGDEF)-like protein